MRASSGKLLLDAVSHDAVSHDANYDPDADADADVDYDAGHDLMPMPNPDHPALPRHPGRQTAPDKLPFIHLQSHLLTLPITSFVSSLVWGRGGADSGTMLFGAISYVG